MKPWECAGITLLMEGAEQVRDERTIKLLYEYQEREKEAEQRGYDIGRRQALREQEVLTSDQCGPQGADPSKQQVRIRNIDPPPMLITWGTYEKVLRKGEEVCVTARKGNPRAIHIVTLLNGASKCEAAWRPGVEGNTYEFFANPDLSHCTGIQ